MRIPWKTLDFLAKAESPASPMMRIGAILLIILSVTAIAAVGLLKSGATDTMVSISGFLISSISLMMMIMISNSQDTVMRDQGSQIRAFHELNDELKARASERERVKKLFLQSQGLTYTCVLPVEYRRRPLPTIAAGDYYAWHIIQNFVGDAQISMLLINRKSQSSAPAAIPDGSLIFLCSPHANPPLNTLCPYLEIDNDHILNKGARDAINLPVWFGTQKEKIVSAADHSHILDWDKKLICHILPEYKVNTISSPVEDLYRQADILKDDEPPTIIGKQRHDHAIIIRASRRLFNVRNTNADDKIIVIAGIHQYGTWIGGHYLQQLCAGQKADYEHVFLSDADFAAVIYGIFDEETLSVKDCWVLDAWSLKGKDWSRQERQTT
jgi:hypothetical protein